MRNELSAGEGGSGSTIELAPSQTIESLIVIDREVDFATALMTQLTYEGLLDETKRKVQLDGSDSLYSSLRDTNTAVVGPILNKVARRLQNTYDSRQSAETTAELRDFVSKLPGFQAEQASLKIHTTLAEEVINRTRTDVFSSILEVQQNIAAGADPATQHDTIEELIARDVPIETALRLLCIESTFGNGMRPRDFETFKRAIIQGYGHQHLLTLASLEKMGMLIPRIV